MISYNNSKNKKTERLFLLDGMALAYRAYFSFINRPLLNSKGENTSAVFGFVSTLMKILNDENPEHIAVVFDTKEPTFRHQMYPPYKATRQKMPEDMVPQIDRLKEVVKAFNVPSIELGGYEADDIIGTLARKAEKEKIEIYLVTGDKDFMQLISPHIKMYRPGKRGDEWEIVDENGVKEKFGVSPELVTDVLGLTGDKSDNVPGVRGVGEKSAIPLVQQFESIENIYKNIDKIPQKGLQQKLKENKENAFLSKKLVTIDTQVPINIEVHDLISKPPDIGRLTEVFTELNFKSLLIKLKAKQLKSEESVGFEFNKSELIDITTDDHIYNLVTTEDEFENLINKLMKSKIFVFDTETTSKNPLQAELVGISFALKPREAWYIPVKKERLCADTSEDEAREQLLIDLNESSTVIHPSHGKSLPLDLLLKKLSPIFSDSRIKKIGQNIKYDILVLANYGIEVNGIVFDTMVANYILRPDAQHNINALAAEHLNYKMISYDDLTGTGRDRKNLLEIDSAKIAEYSNQDADITFRLYEALREKLAEQKLNKLCEDIEFPLIKVLGDMELSGVKLDLAFLADLSKELERILDNLTTDIYNFAGEKFNINSTQQLSKILFDKLKLSTFRKTKTGYSTDFGVLEALRHEHPVVEKLLDYRQLQKLKTTYIDAFPSLINRKTGKVHTSFNQTITATGRLSSSDPNLQNIPIRTEIGSRIRKAFIPSSPEMLIMSADYSQIELRIVAHISGDQELITAFKNREDIHASTASKVFGVKPDDVTKEMRRRAKEVNFGIIYGIGPYGLATRLDISQTEAKDIITKYFERFPKVNQYIFDTIAKARHDGYVSTLLGRRRYLPDINSRNQNIRNNAQRQAINMPIQGTAADMIKLAMINIQSKIQNFRSKMLLQVHDELVFEISKSEEKRIRNLIIEGMRDALSLSVPIEVEVGVGKNWFEAH